MSHYSYTAHERPGAGTSTIAEAIGPITDRLAATSPDDMIVAIAHRIAPLGDGPTRLRALASILIREAGRAEDLTVQRMVRKLEGFDDDMATATRLVTMKLS